MPKKIMTKRAFFIASARLEDLLLLDPGDFVRDIMAPEHRPERVEEIVVMALFDHKMDICEFGGVGLTRIDADYGSLHLAFLVKNPRGKIE